MYKNKANYFISLAIWLNLLYNKVEEILKIVFSAHRSVEFELCKILVRSMFMRRDGEEICLI